MIATEVRVINVLLVEDDPGDVLMTREAFEEYLHNRLDVVSDGCEALAYLRREGKYADAPRVDLILLDLNLPRRDGREVLAEIKADERLRHIPVIVLTTSRAAEDVLVHCEQHGIGFIPWFPLATGELSRPGGRLATLAAAKGATPAQLALAWLLRRSPVMLPIPGTSKVAHLEENMAAAGITLTDEEYAALESAV